MGGKKQATVGNGGREGKEFMLRPFLKLKFCREKEKVAPAINTVIVSMMPPYSLAKYLIRYFMNVQEVQKYLVSLAQLFQSHSIKRYTGKISIWVEFEKYRYWKW